MLVNEFLEQSARISPGKIALVCQNKRFTFSEVDSTANSFANALISQGLERQDRVVIYLENSTESVVAIFGTLKASGVFVVVNPQVKSKKLGYILNDSQVRFLITDAKHLFEISDIIPNCPYLNSIIITDYDTLDAGFLIHCSESKTILSYTTLLAGFSSVQPPKRNIDIDLASLIYTSGSTGNPKGVMLTHLNMVSAANSIVEYLKNSSDDIILDCLPLSFDYGLYQVLMALKFGGRVILEKSFLYPYQIIDLIVKEKVTGFPFVPAILAILLQLKNLEKIDFSNLRYVTNTAQALSTNHIRQFRRLFPHVRFYSMYGLTECKRVSYLPPEEIDRRPTSVGKAMPNIEACIVDENGNKVTRPGQVGELVIRGANIMKGYWNQPELTAQKLKLGPWIGENVLYSGDLFKMDEDGFLYFVSRKDEIIKTAGEMVSPREVEAVIYELENVAEVAVIGVPDEILGNVIKAFIVLNNGAALTEEKIVTHCANRLERFMVPKNVEFCQRLPKTVTGKIRKKELV